MKRKVGVYVKSRGAALIRDAATNREFTVVSFTEQNIRVNGYVQVNKI